MKNLALAKKITMIALYCIGFPILAIVALAESIKWNNFGMYGAGAFTPFILVLVIWAVAAGITGLVYFLTKKKGKSPARVNITAAIVPIVLIFGLFLIFEAAMPQLMAEGTSNTIFYEDVLEDSMGVHNKLVDRVEDFKKKNNLDANVKASDKEFQNVFSKIYPSMDKAYKAFDPLAIKMALRYPNLMDAVTSGKIPVSVLATLMLKSDAEINVNNHTLTVAELLKLNDAEITETLNTVFANISKISDPAVLNDAIGKLLVTKEFDGIKWNIFQILGSNMLAPTIDPNGEIVKVTEVDGVATTENLGGCLGYMDMAWLNGLSDMFFIPLMNFKAICFGFAIGIAFLALISEVARRFFDEAITQAV